MVELCSFNSPKTVPHQYKVDLLCTQYRSIPIIGNLFSQLTYDGILKHDRTDSSQRKLNIEDTFDMETFNIIKFPVRTYESIYCSKHLHHSPCHTYSVLFSVEFVAYLASLLARCNKKEIFRIGIISPYRAQANLIDKLLVTKDIPNNIEIKAGTIHKFQGDECDIVIVVYNPPKRISAKAFLNKKNIINVSISRARDYLFILMPDDQTESVDSLSLIKEIERICQNSGHCKIYESSAIEKLMFHDENYLEKNSFSTGHHEVNVYHIPESKYEIRSDNNAIDIQVHKKIQHGENMS